MCVCVCLCLSVCMLGGMCMGMCLCLMQTLSTEAPEPLSESMSVDKPKVSASQPTAESAPPMPPDSDALRATGNECVRCVCTLAIEFQHSFKSRVHVCVVLLLLFGGFVFVVAVLLLWNLSQTPQKQ